MDKTDEQIVELAVGKLCEILGTEKIPFTFEKMEDDSRYYNVIVPHITINKKYEDNFIEIVKCLAHEYRHVFQRCYVKIFPNQELSIKWEKALNSPINSKSMKTYEEYLTNELEFDAFAFTKYFMKEYLNLSIEFPVKEYDKLLNKYIERYADIVKL